MGIPGLGDSAFHGARSGVLVLAGDSLLDVRVITTAGEPDLAAATALAQGLVAQL